MLIYLLRQSNVPILLVIIWLQLTLYSYWLYYDAINTGLDNIHQYASKHSVVSNCDKLIICITDGINNRGKLTIDNLK